MPTVEEIAKGVRDELAQLRSEFASAMRNLQAIGDRIEVANQKVVGMQKQTTNEAQPNPEVNATTPKE